VEEELERLQREGILRPVESSEWAAPIVVVRKGDDSIRICGGYKVSINPYLDANAYPMPNPQDLFLTVAGGKDFSKLDMKQAYQQMQVDEQSQKYLTVNANKGFLHTRMPFGISTALEYGRERWMEFCQEFLESFVILNDILVVGIDLFLHLVIPWPYISVSHDIIKWLS
jgi:hypothetical protein